MNIKKYKTKFLLTMLPIVLSAGIITGCGSKDADSGLFVAVSSNGNGQIAYSEDGTKWTIATGLPAGFKPYNVCYGNGMFSALEYTGKVAYSTDGNQWEVNELLVSLVLPGMDWISICNGNGKFVVVSRKSNPGDGCLIANSPDGITWEHKQISINDGYGFDYVCYGKGRFVAIPNGLNNSNMAVYSDDGSKWEATELPFPARWYRVCYGKGRFIAVGLGQIAFSTNGINWSSASLPVSLQNKSWYSVSYGNGMFVAIDMDGSAVFSADGIHWELTSFVLDAPNGVSYGNGKFVAIDNNGSTAFSIDGIHWTAGGKISDNTGWQEITFGFDNDIFGFL